MHCAEIARPESKGVQGLQHHDRRQPGQSTREDPTDDSGRAPNHHQSVRAKPGEQTLAVPEQQDPGNGALSPKHANRRLRETKRAPVKSSKTVIDLVTGLQCRGTDDKTENLRLPTKARISANRLEPRVGCLCCGTARRASVRSAEAPRTSKSASAPQVEASTVPLPSEARIKLTEPQSRIRP